MLDILNIKAIQHYNRYPPISLKSITGENLEHICLEHIFALGYLSFRAVNVPSSTFLCVIRSPIASRKVCRYVFTNILVILTILVGLEFLDVMS